MNHDRSVAINCGQVRFYPIAPGFSATWGYDRNTGMVATGVSTVTRSTPIDLMQPTIRSGLGGTWLGYTWAGSPANRSDGITLWEQ